MHDSDNALLTYYAQAGTITDPKGYAYLFDDLRTEIDALVKVVQGFMVHIFWAGSYKLELSDARKAEVQLRRVDRQLARVLELDPLPLAAVRSYEKKLVGNCRDFSVMMTAILRHHGIPARARCGFGTYFLPNHYEDHWVCEYWNAGQKRWVLVDAQLDALMLGVLKPDFSPLDVPRDRFIVGGQAWQMCRSGKADPDAFGIFDMHGLWFVVGDLVRDFMALNKVEILPWDGGWGWLGEVDPGVRDAFMDRIAALSTGGDATFEEMRALFDSDAGFRTPADW